MIVDVAFPIPVHKNFSYSVPENLKHKIRMGIRISAPFGKRTAAGWVVGCKESTRLEGIKEIAGVIEEPVPEGLYKLAEWISGYYVCSMGLSLSIVFSRNLGTAKKKGAEYDGSFSEKLPAWLPLPGQKEIIEELNLSITGGRTEKFLLKGESDTGKTEVLMHCINTCQQENKSAIYLVPEISLTAQFIKFFTGRFGQEKVSVWHGKISTGERSRIKRSCERGDALIIIGTMSALFVPVKNLGLLVVDEEQDSSYKHDRMPFYNARDVAVKRAEYENAVVVLSSSTPSFESMHAAKSGAYRLLTLSERIGCETPPEIRILDMKNEAKVIAGYPGLSKKILDALAGRVKRGEQAILLSNRKGYFRKVMCSACSSVLKCQKCGIPLVSGEGQGRLSCYYCGSMLKVPEKCPACNCARMSFSGAGTKRLEMELKKLLPEAKVARVDSETVAKPKDAARIFYDFSRGKKDVLVGTQLVSKGWDFPKVTLVGVISADELLWMPDFRAGERFVSAVLQAAGRSGRGRNRGEVMVQAYCLPDKLAKVIVENNYDTFYNDEILFRKEFNYPPFSRLVNISIYGKKEEAVEKAAVSFFKRIKEELCLRPAYRENENVFLLGPCRAPFYKVRNDFRWQVIIKEARPLAGSGLEEILKNAVCEFHSGAAGLRVDVDPARIL